MAAVLALTDLQGSPFTGVRADLSDGNPGHAYQIYARPPRAAAPGDVTGAEISADGSGQGTADVPVTAPGVWGFSAVGGDTGGPFWGAASEAADDAYNRFIDHLMALLLTLQLPEIGERIYDRIVEDTGGEFPNLQVAVAELVEGTIPAGVSASGYSFPARLTVADRHQAAELGQRRRYLNWRGRIRDALQNRKMPGVYKLTLEPQFVLLESKVEALYLISVMVVRGQVQVAGG
jgi:hypothetical protein